MVAISYRSRKPKVNIELPAITLTYCLPFTAYVIGPAATDGPRFVCHNSLPLRASSAKNDPSRPPLNNMSDAVVSTPVSVDGAESLWVHRFMPVFGSIAWMALWTSSVAAPGRGKTPVNPAPHGTAAECRL